MGLGLGLGFGFGVRVGVRVRVSGRTMESACGASTADGMHLE